MRATGAGPDGAGVGEGCVVGRGVGVGAGVGEGVGPGIALAGGVGVGVGGSVGSGVLGGRGRRRRRSPSGSPSGSPSAVTAGDGVVVAVLVGEARDVGRLGAETDRWLRRPRGGRDTTRARVLRRESGGPRPRRRRLGTLRCHEHRRDQEQQAHRHDREHERDARSVARRGRPPSRGDRSAALDPDAAAANELEDDHGASDEQADGEDDGELDHERPCWTPIWPTNGSSDLREATPGA